MKILGIVYWSILNIYKQRKDIKIMEVIIKKTGMKVQRMFLE